MIWFFFQGSDQLQKWAIHQTTDELTVNSQLDIAATDELTVNSQLDKAVTDELTVNNQLDKAVTDEMTDKDKSKDLKRQE